MYRLSSKDISILPKDLGKIVSSYYNSNIYIRFCDEYYGDDEEFRANLRNRDTPRFVTFGNVPFENELTTYDTVPWYDLDDITFWYNVTSISNNHNTSYGVFDSDGYYLIGYTYISIYFNTYKISLFQEKAIHWNKDCECVTIDDNVGKSIYLKHQLFKDDDNIEYTVINLY